MAEGLKYFCANGVIIKDSVICTVGDVISIWLVRNDKRIECKGIKGWCDNTEFILTPKEFVDNFVLLD